MLKESIICIIIIIGILGLEFYTQNFTKKTVNEITEIFSKIKDEIGNKDIQQINNEIKYINNRWEEKQKKLAYYIEHGELEKVKTAIVKMESYIQTGNYSSALAELEEGKFVLEHIQDKNAFNLQTIF